MRPVSAVRLPYALVAATALLALVVVGLGAFVRLSDAGLGCPDWPGCYGAVSPHHAAEEIAAAQALQPDGPVSPAKAWKEMLHRYLASGLGVLILAIAYTAWRRERGLNRWLALGLVALVVFQGLLGMWTVTLQLKPVVVSAHLLGGMSTLALLVWLASRLDGRAVPRPGSRPPVTLAGLALAAVVAQIALGGWVSSNYAALACSGFPTCGGAWWPHADWARAFQIERALGLDGSGEALRLEALTAMHWAHRLGAVLVTVVVGSLAWRLIIKSGFVRFGWLLLGLLAGQLSLGVVNVLASLPLAVAVAHNVVGAVLLASLVRVNAAMRRTG